MAKFKFPSNPKKNPQMDIKNMAGAKRYARLIFVTHASNTATRKITATNTTSAIRYHPDLFHMAV
jgi:hypothetical protein